jgi:hypothetical protein
MFHCPLFAIIRLQYSVDHYTLCLLLDRSRYTVFTAAINNKTELPVRKNCVN